MCENLFEMRNVGEVKIIFKHEICERFRECLHLSFYYCYYSHRSERRQIVYD